MVKVYFLQAIFMVSLWADENETVTKQLEKLQQQLQEVESKLKTISETLKKFPKILSNISNLQNKL